MRKRTILTALLGTLLAFGVIVGTTLAYLTATATPVTNTFTVGEIEIDLDEPSYKEPEGGTKLYPGAVIPKDPRVTVKGGSESSWVYMLLDNQLNFELTNPTADAITLNIHANWTFVNTVGTKTLYRFHQIVPANVADQILTPLFTSVTVSTRVNADNIDDLDGGKLIISAYAHQSTGQDQTAADTAAKLHFGVS